MLFRIISCPSCGHESNGQGKSCNNCGAPLAQHDLITKIQPKLQPLSPHKLGSGDTSKNLLEHAKKLLSEGKVRESEVIFKQVIASGQNLSEGFYSLGYIRKEQGDLPGATTQFKNAVQEDPKNANALYWLGWIAQEQNSWEAARAFYGRALAINPQHRGAIAALKQHPDYATPYRGHHGPHFVGNATLTAPHGVVPLMTGGTLPTGDGAELYAYGIYGILLQNSSPTSKATLALIEDLRMIDIHPRFSAFLGMVLGPLFWMITFGIGGLISLPLVASLVAQTHLPYVYLVTGLPFVFSILCLIRLIKDCLYINSIRMTIDKGRVQETSGYLSTESWSEELWRVRTIDIQRTLLNRLTGDGSLTFTFDHREPTEFRGLVKGDRLYETRQQLLNLVGFLRANPALKGILQ